MSAGLVLGPEQIDALREIGNIRAGNAATALLLESAFGADDPPSAGDFLDIPSSEALTTVLERLGLGE